ncbi:thioesterase family protein [Caldanaerobius fijiensis]|uniref:thioesterase family protein n=1 Tax=Caldanaerobius fijiensis TaxID=456330 RepID=UPI000AC640D6|nr:thioesterase family protein [Caldanaerobius fijiensis]
MHKRVFKTLFFLIFFVIIGLIKNFRKNFRKVVRLLEYGIQVGLNSTIETIVEEKDLAVTYGSGSVRVLATPAMISLMEKAAMFSVELHLPGDKATVGTNIAVKHLRPTPLGMKIRIYAELINIDNRRLTFKVEAYDEVEKIGEGTHERYIIDVDKFMEKCENKLNR